MNLESQLKEKVKLLRASGISPTQSIVQTLTELKPEVIDKVKSGDVFAGQALASLLYETVDSGLSGPINDFDIFKIDNENELTTKTTILATLLDTVQCIEGETTGEEYQFEVLNSIDSDQINDITFSLKSANEPVNMPGNLIHFFDLNCTQAALTYSGGKFQTHITKEFKEFIKTGQILPNEKIITHKQGMNLPACHLKTYARAENKSLSIKGSKFNPESFNDIWKKFNAAPSLFMTGHCEDFKFQRFLESSSLRFTDQEKEIIKALSGHKEMIEKQSTNDLVFTKIAYNAINKKRHDYLAIIDQVLNNKSDFSNKDKSYYLESRRHGKHNLLFILGKFSTELMQQKIHEIYSDEISKPFEARGIIPVEFPSSSLGVTEDKLELLKHLHAKLNNISQKAFGKSLTEFYDIAELESRKESETEPEFINRF